MKDKNTEILIIGGGSAGIAAAIEASKNGKVTLVDANPYLGGNATASEVGTICGLYTYTKAQQVTFLVNGFAKEFAERLQKLSKSEVVKNKENLCFLPYQTDAFKQLCSQYIQKSNVDVHLNTKITNISVEDDKITQVELSGLQGKIDLHPKSVVDCTGNSMVSQLANIETHPLRSPQAAAMVFTLENIAAENEFAVTIQLTKILHSIHTGKSNLHKAFQSAHLIPGSLKNGTANFKIGIPSSSQDETKLRSIGKNTIREFCRFIQTKSTTFQGAELKKTADNVGIRSGICSLGRYTLTEKDVFSGKKFETSIAKSAWPMEEWKEDLQVHLTPLTLDDWYEIPKECLISSKVNNLFFAGKCISATEKAIASARVMGTCLQTGQAAGKLATKNCKFEIQA